jgi:hypothetical protein
MKKLRLIKPWQLRALRQRLEVEIKEEKINRSDRENTDPSSLAPEVFTFRKPLIDKRVGLMEYNTLEKAANAPLSDVIFAWSIKENIR